MHPPTCVSYNYYLNYVHNYITVYVDCCQKRFI